MALSNEKSLNDTWMHIINNQAFIYLDVDLWELVVGVFTLDPSYANAAAGHDWRSIHTLLFTGLSLRLRAEQITLLGNFTFASFKL